MDISRTRLNALIQKISAAKFRIVAAFPFYGVLIMDTKLMLDPKEKSLSTNGKAIFFNPDFLESLTNEELDISLIHEIFHIILKHPFRFKKSMDNDLYHLAADTVVNANIMASNERTQPLVVKGNELPYKAPDGKPADIYTVEEVYKMLCLKNGKVKEAQEMDKQDSILNPKADTNEQSKGPDLVHQIFNFVPEYTETLYFRQVSYINYAGNWIWDIDDQYNPPKTSINPLLFIKDKLNNTYKTHHVKCRIVEDNQDFLPCPDYMSKFKTIDNDLASIIESTKEEFDYFSILTDESLIDYVSKASFSSKQIEKDEATYRKFVHKKYLSVSPLHKTFFAKLAKDNGIDPSNPYAMVLCRNLIAKSAKYNLKYKKNESGKDDILYFLTEAKEGICFHFATALVMFLRSIGIPARYTTGYLGEGRAHQEEFIFQESGHAWVEAYLDGTGWLRLDPTPVSANPDCGSMNISFDGQEGEKEKKESKENKNKNSKGSFDSHERWKEASDSSEKMLSEEEIDALLIKAYEAQESQGNGTGKLPGFIQSIISNLRHPRIDWRTLLNEFVQEDVNDYSFVRPDKRFQENDFIMPSFSEQDETIKNILFMVDCSGSMSTKDISDCYSEIKGAIDQFGGKLKGYMAFFDTMVYKRYEIDENTNIENIKPIGRGGTDFSCVFRYIKAMMEDDLPTSVIILTDGYAAIPDERISMDIPTFWAILSDDINSRDNLPTWGKVALIPKSK